MRRQYFMRLEVREYCGHDQGAPPVLAAKSVRARLGVFQTNKWREKAESVIREFGFEPNFNYGVRTKVCEWDHIVFAYGTFDKGGRGRCGSTLWRIPAKRLDGQKAKTPWNELSREETTNISRTLNRAESTGA